MKKLLLISASLVAISAAAPASAADLAARPYTKAPPMMAAIYDWSGFYIGINGGGGFGRSTWDSTGGFNTSGGLVGATAGYNYQIGQYVWGLEADVSGRV